MGKRHLMGRELYRLLFYGVILVVVGVGALAYWGVHEIRRDAAEVAVQSSARGLSGAVTVLLNSVQQSSATVGKGLPASLKSLDLRKQFAPVMRENKKIAAMVVSDGKGLHYMLARHGDDLVEAVTNDEHTTVKWGRLVKGRGSVDHEFKGWHMDLPALDELLVGEQQHLQPGQVNWRSASHFKNLSGSWIFASTLLDASDGTRFMLSISFPVDTVLSQLGGAERGAAERVFLYWGNGMAMPVDGLGTPEQEPEISTEPLKVRQLSDPVIQKAVKDLAANGSDKPFRFVVDGEVWWGYALPLTVFGDTLSLGVAVPMTRIISSLTSDSFLQVGGVILILAAFLALYFLHRNRARILAMGARRAAAVSGQDVLELVANGESARLEFKQTLRFNLKSGKNGREIEHACLKTVTAFLNSDGGTLLVGVADDGSITGFPEDKFSNGDHALLHFNNLVNTHLGPEFSRYMDSAVINCGDGDQDKQVLRIYCVTSPVPAILDMGKGEEFYVRSGPASRSLTLKQFYEWLKEHK